VWILMLPNQSAYNFQGTSLCGFTIKMRPGNIAATRQNLRNTITCLSTQPFDTLTPRFPNSHMFNDARIPCHLVHTFSGNPPPFGEV